MRIHLTLVAVSLLLTTCNGCEEYREGLRRLRQLFARSRTASDQVPEGAYGLQRRRIYSLPIRRRILTGSKLCPGSRISCPSDATCVVTEDGHWGCRSSRPVQINESPTITRIIGSRIQGRPHRGRYTQTRYSLPYPFYPTLYTSRHTRRTCFSGFKRVNLTSTTFKCLDRNECEDSQNICPAKTTCINNEGSFECVCKKGYRADEKSPMLCNEIDECEEGDPCDKDKICLNTWGSFECKEPVECPLGYVTSNATQGSIQHCMRNTSALTDDPDAPDIVSYIRVAVKANKRPEGRIGFVSLNLTGGYSGYEHCYLRVVGEEAYFWHERRRSNSECETLDLDIFTMVPLEAGVVHTYTLLITHELASGFGSVPLFFFRGDSCYCAQSDGRQHSETLLTMEHKVVLEIVPMTHGESDEY